MLQAAFRSGLVACIDLEATCTDDIAQKPHYRNEIIEVGIAVLDMKTLQVAEVKQLYVRPTTTEVLSFCTQLTGITPERVADAPSFAQAMQELDSLIRKLRLEGMGVWGSFGEYDRKQFMRQCAAEGVANPMQTTRHLNVKAAAQMALQSRKGLGLNRAVERLGLQFHGQHHSGVDDAVNVANVLAAVTRKLLT